MAGVPSQKSDRELGSPKPQACAHQVSRSRPALPYQTSWHSFSPHTPWATFFFSMEFKLFPSYSEKCSEAVQMPLQYPVESVLLFPGVIELHHMLLLFWIFWDTRPLIPSVATQVYIPTRSQEGFLSPSSSAPLLSQWQPFSSGEMESQSNT